MNGSVFREFGSVAPVWVLVDSRAFTVDLCCRMSKDI